MEYEGTKIIRQCAIEEVTKLLAHVRKGCLSDIAPSGGTSYNEGIHSSKLSLREVKDWNPIYTGTSWPFWND